MVNEPVLDPVTVGELARTIKKMDERIQDQFKAVNDRLDKLQYVNQETYRIQMKMVERRLDSLEEARTWTWRAMVDRFVLPALVATLTVLLMLLLL